MPGRTPPRLRRYSDRSRGNRATTLVQQPLNEPSERARQLVGTILDVLGHTPGDVDNALAFLRKNRLEPMDPNEVVRTIRERARQFGIRWYVAIMTCARQSNAARASSRPLNGMP